MGALVLDVELPSTSDPRLVERLRQSLTSTGRATPSDESFVVTAHRLTLSHPDRAGSSIFPNLAAIFVPQTLTDSALDGLEVKVASAAVATDAASTHDSNLFLSDPETKQSLSKRLLSLVHPFLSHNFTVKGVLSVRADDHAPADVVLIDLSHTPSPALEELLETTNCQLIHSGPDSLLKMILLSRVLFGMDEKRTISSFEIPTCPVCLHRIDPLRLGLPKPANHHLCSKYCPPPNLVTPSVPRDRNASFSGDQHIPCAQQRLLKPWSRPSHCKACAVVDRYWRSGGEGDDLLFCVQCAMQETLWVCLTCGFVGCGRYSNKHAAEHFVDTQHPYSLELATLRIWDYVSGDFAHRIDLLECPCSPPLMQPWIRLPPTEPNSSFHAQETSFVDRDEMKAPKKATMIGEEYEALLQSALEEQAQHYEGEITHLKARLTEEHVDQSAMTKQEAIEIEGLRAEIAGIRLEIDRATHELLQWQSREAEYRAQSQSLLLEQQVSQELLEKVLQETSNEREEGKMQVEELEQQIADLTANQKMRRQFSQDEELQQAQIWGLSSDAKSKKGKKPRRLFRSK